MSEVTRQKVIAGNWKMYHGPVETGAWIRAFVKQPLPADRTVILIPPAISIPAATDALSRHSDIRVGVQNIYWEENGAFTGETSARMAAGAGATFALCGHSERRKLFGDTDEAVGKKANAAHRHGMIPIICVGETAQERKAGEVEAVLTRQLTAALAGIRPEVPFMVAYEPVWAIGTGNNATPHDAASAHAFIRKLIGELRSADVAQSTQILYGGSVKPENASHLLGADDVDGLLVGGASLETEGFARICNAPAVAPPPLE
ncbi:MAG TPA: triose-phosphate isomerase [Longimicrobiales bacterium]